MEANRRGTRRTDAFRIGAIVFGDPPVSVDCLVWDQSETGAQIELQTVDDIPGTFVLTVTAYARPRPCEVIWRRDRKVGVRFTA